MCDNQTHASSLPDRQQTAVARSRQERQDVLKAMHDLEASLAAPAPGREKAWGMLVVENLRYLENILQASQTTGQQANHLWSELELVGPSVKRRIEQLRRQLQDIMCQTSSLRSQLEEALDGKPDYADFRRRLAWLLSAIRHYRDQEADLIYEVYNVDIGAAD